MGGGNFDTKKYHKAAVSYKQQDRTTLFQQPRIFQDFNPLQVTVRESCASTEHPDPTSIIIACDVTGSMGKIPENLLKGGLGKIMESLLHVTAISNPQVMFAAVGDTECDNAPLQVTQFESDNRIAEQLKNLYLEGGGGGNSIESYHAIWYFAAYKTRLDSWKNGKKGVLFTMGDEMLPPILKADHIRQFIDKDYIKGDIPTDQLFRAVTEKYDVFHLIVQDTYTYSGLGAERVNACWRQHLGERAILVSKYVEIPAKIVTILKLFGELNLAAKPAPAPLESIAPSKVETKCTSEAVATEIGFLGSKASRVKAAIASDVALSKDSDDVPHLFIDPILQAVMKDPVVAEDGYTYERASICAWFQKHDTSPMTNMVIGKLLLPNHSLKSEIEQWQETVAHRAVVP